jgi:hypothetical protein
MEDNKANPQLRKWAFELYYQIVYDAKVKSDLGDIGFIEKTTVGSAKLKEIDNIIEKAKPKDHLRVVEN